MTAQEMIKASKSGSIATPAQAAAKPAVPATMAGMRQKDIGALLQGMSDRIAMALPKHLTADRIIQMAATTIARNPSISECTTQSLCGAVLQASILGFPPVDALGYCYLVPYNNKTGKEVQFQIGYKGYIDLARRSGKIKDIYAEVVREGDEFEAIFGLDRSLTHKPKFDTSKPITFVYAVAHLNDGGVQFIVLPVSEIERLRIRGGGRSEYLTGAWKTDYEAMAKAKAIKQLAKYLPLSLDEFNGMASDGAIMKPEDFDHGSLKTEAIDLPEESIYEVVDEETGEISVEEGTKQPSPAEAPAPSTPTTEPATPQAKGKPFGSRATAPSPTPAYEAPSAKPSEAPEGGELQF